jgi:hypothetical protein
MSGVWFAARGSIVRLAGQARFEVGEPMTVRKGEATYRQVDRDYPMQIEVRIDGDDWMMRHAAIVEYCAPLDHKKRPVGRERRIAINADAVRLCFKIAELAESFRAHFGGELLPPLTRDRRSRAKLI